MDNFRIKTCVLGMVSTNCYIVYRETERKEGQPVPAVVIDPAAQVDKIIRMCQELKVRPEAVLLTHGHFDHMMAADSLRKEYGIPVYAGTMEQDLLERADLNLSTAFGNTCTLKADVFLEDQQEICLAGMYWKVLFTPGHTQGSVCYLPVEEEVIFSGDTLFLESLGRTDFPTSSTAQIVRSITEKLFELPDDWMVYPGHGDPTTIGHEKECNPVACYYKGSDGKR